LLGIGFIGRERGGEVMQTKVENFDGVDLRIPVSHLFFWPATTFDTFPTCCGPGEGWGDRLVPDSILGLKISPACWVHDRMFEAEEKTWNNYYYSNSVMLTNMLEINRVRGGNWLVRQIRKPIILCYLKGVTTMIGSKLFFRLEK